MADENQKISITVSASTASAVQEVDKLSKAIRAQTAATDEGSKAQKTLGKEVKETKLAQQEAAEAVARAKQVQSEHNLVVQAFGPKSREAAESAQRLAKANEEAASAAKKAADALEKVTKETAKAAEAEGDKLSPATRRAAQDLEKMAREADKTASEVRKLDIQLDKAKSSMTGFMASFTGNLAANAVSAVGSKLADLGMYSLETAANFERLKTALATTLGSQEAAAKAFKDIQEFAAATPFSVDEVTEAFLKLKNRGLDASKDTLRAYGDMASAMGKSLDDMVEAVADAVTGEGERLKEFGIVSKKEGDKISYTFRGVKTDVAFSAKEIEKYLVDLGKTNFAGGMEAQSRTLGGMWSTMKDGFDQFLVSVMDSGITSSLKDVMGTFSGMSETGKLLSDILSVTLGGAFTIAAGAIKGAAAAVELMATGLNTLLSPIHMVVDAAKPLVDDVFGALAVEARRVSDEHAVLAASIEPVERGTGTLVDRFLSAQDAALGYTGSLWDQARALLEVEANSRKAADANEAMWTKLQKKQDAAEEAAAFAAFEKANAMGPALPPGFDAKKKGGKKKKPSASDAEKERALSEAKYSFNKDVEAETLKQVAVAREEAFSAEQSMRAARLQGLDQELELLDKKIGKESEDIEMLFFVVDQETEMEARRRALQDERVEREIQLADWEEKNAISKEDREAAAARAAEARHKKQLHLLARQQEAEEKAARHRMATIRTVTAVQQKALDIGLSAAEAAMREEKNIGLKMLASMLDAIKQQAKVKILYHTAEAIGAFASYRYAAGAQHLAAAAAYGVLWGGAAAGQAAINKKISSNEASREEAEKAKEEADKAREEQAGKSEKGGISVPRGGRGDTNGVPTSYDDSTSWQGRNQGKDPAMSKPQGGTVIQINNPQFLGATPVEVGRSLNRLMRDADRTLGGLR